jgi:two-component system, LytTR family, sensor kinase
MITQLSELLRLTLRASRAHEIPLSEELEITRLYMDLMQKRFENKLRVTYSIDPSLNNSLVPQLILQPLLENSLRHGMKSGAAVMELSVSAHRENGSLILQVLDTGVGLGEMEPSGVFGRGLGLSNIRDRLAQLYGEGQQFSIVNRPTGGAEVTLRVPLHHSNQLSQAVE